MQDIDAFVNILLNSRLFQEWLGPIIITLAATFITYSVQPKAKIVWAQPHAFSFTMRPEPPAQPFLVHTYTVTIQNAGREPAEGVEVFFSSRPSNLHVWPTMAYEESNNPEGFYVIGLPNLGRKEWVNIEIMHPGPNAPLVTRVRSKVGEGRSMQLRPIRVLPRWVHLGMAALEVIGAFALIRFFLSVLL